MDKPMTARQFALILWGPVLVGLAIWWAVTTFTEGQRRADARNEATAQAVRDTEASGRRLERDLQVLNEAAGEGR